MVARLFLNLGLAFVWCLLQDEISLRQFLIGCAVGVAAMLFFPRSFQQERRYLRKVRLSFQLALFFVKELIIANWTVLKQVLAPRLTVRSGIIAYPLELHSDIHVDMNKLLCSLVTLYIVHQVMSENNKNL